MCGGITGTAENCAEKISNCYASHIESSFEDNGRLSLSKALPPKQERTEILQYIHCHNSKD